MKKLGGKRLENCAYCHVPSVETKNGMIRVCCRCGLSVEKKGENAARKSWNNLVAEQKKRKKRFVVREELSREIIECMKASDYSRKVLNNFHDGRLMR